MQNLSQTITILPPATIGILGGGQLGQMLAIAARQMGYNVAILDPDSNAPAKHFANLHIVRPFDDTEALRQLAAHADVITTEFENVPAASVEFLQQLKPVYPGAHALAVTQNRLKEKEFFRLIGVNTVDFYTISTPQDIENVDESIFPAILKTATNGYDGKGQIIVNNKLELVSAFDKLNRAHCILEQKINLASEASVIVARNHSETQVYAVNENIHANNILDVTICPARISAQLSEQLQQNALKIIDKLDYIGLLVIEFFITQDNRILANEMAPRPHNSGHHTIESTVTSQFEQQLRAVCNLKLGSTRLHSAAVMLNILGDKYTNNRLDNLQQLLTQYSNLKLHIYGKTNAQLGRKMGHLTCIGDDIDKLLLQTNEIKQLWRTLND